MHSEFVRATQVLAMRIHRAVHLAQIFARSSSSAPRVRSAKPSYLEKESASQQQRQCLSIDLQVVFLGLQ